MGFEVIFRYHEEMEDGGYNKEEIKEMSRKIGDPFEDISLETLAQKIMAQMARRDIWVLPDVDIYELKKQKVNFKPCKGGVVIKNKKFFLDSENNSIVCQDIPETPQPGTTHALAPIPQPGTTIAPHNNLPTNIQQNTAKRPIKMVVLDDTGAILDESGGRMPVMAAVKRRGLAFRPGQKYPVFQEMDDPRDKRLDAKGHPALDRRKVYVMWDDNRRDVTVSQDYFVPADIKLERSLADDPWDDTSGGGGRAPKLMFEQEEGGAAMPDLRGGR